MPSLLPSQMPRTDMLLGMGYPLFNAFLPQYLSTAGGQAVSENTTYRDYAITSVVGVPGSILACYTVNVKYVGRKGTMAIATLLSGIFLILFTRGNTSGYQLVMSSLEAFFQNIMVSGSHLSNCYHKLTICSTVSSTHTPQKFSQRQTAAQVPEYPAH